MKNRDFTVPSTAVGLCLTQGLNERTLVALLLAQELVAGHELDCACHRRYMKGGTELVCALHKSYMTGQE